MTLFSVLLLSFSIIVSLAAAPSFLQQNNALAQQDAKASVQEMSTHINEALKAYTSAIGEKYFEAEHAPIQINQILIEQAKGVGEGKLVDRAAYQLLKTI